MYTVYDNADDSTSPYSGCSTAVSCWGETRYLTAAQWGTAGATLLGTSMQSTGTQITSASQGMVLSSTTLAAYVASTVYSQTWYQPKWASTYATSALRRYNGGANEGDKVKAYCVGALMSWLVGARSITDTSADNVPVAGTVVTVTGAMALTAGAIAFGVSALAM